MAQLATWEARTDQRIKAVNMNRRLKALQDRREADLDRRRQDLACKLAAEQQVSCTHFASRPWQAKEVSVMQAVQDTLLIGGVQACSWCSLAGPVWPSMSPAAPSAVAGGFYPSCSCLRPDARTCSRHGQPLEALRLGWSSL